jgi:hypothetical protein
MWRSDPLVVDCLREGRPWAAGVWTATVITAGVTCEECARMQTAALAIVLLLAACRLPS